MIRYTCETCGKSLRAEEKIVGRKAPCTRCGAISRVPGTSTRKSGEHQKLIPPTTSNKSLDADSSQDAVHDSADLSTESGIKIPLPRQLYGAREALAGESTEVDSAEPFEPVFRRVERKKSFLSPTALFFAAMTMLLLAFAFWFLNSGRAEAENTPTEFEQTGEAIKFQTAMFDLKKSQRVLSVMTEGYLTAKEVPESSLDDLREFRSALDQFTSENIAIEEANDLYDAGHHDAAIELIERETAIVSEFDANVQKRIREIQSKTYE